MLVIKITGQTYVVNASRINWVELTQDGSFLRIRFSPQDMIVFKKKDADLEELLRTIHQAMWVKDGNWVFEGKIR